MSTVNNENFYQPPESELTNELKVLDIVAFRKGCLPIWIKIFGWLFIVAGGIVAIISIFTAVSGGEGRYSLYGLNVYGKIYSPLVLLVIALFIAHGICAFGLLFAKAWGVDACILLGYISAFICVFTMFVSNTFQIRLELIALIFYLIKLHKLQPYWKSGKLEKPVIV